MSEHGEGPLPEQSARENATEEVDARPTPTSNVSTGRVAVICGLLLLASAINYLDRQTLASASARIKSEFSLLNEQYGDVEAAFGYGFVRRKAAEASRATDPGWQKNGGQKDKSG